MYIYCIIPVRKILPASHIFKTMICVHGKFLVLKLRTWTACKRIAQGQSGDITCLWIWSQQNNASWANLNAIAWFNSQQSWKRIHHLGDPTFQNCLWTPTKARCPHRGSSLRFSEYQPALYRLSDTGTRSETLPNKGIQHNHVWTQRTKIL